MPAEQLLGALDGRASAALHSAVIDAVRVRGDRSFAPGLARLLDRAEVAESAAHVMIELVPSAAARELPAAIERLPPTDTKQMLVRAAGELASVSADERAPLSLLLDRISDRGEGLLQMSEAVLARRRLGGSPPARIGVATMTRASVATVSVTISVATADPEGYLLFFALREPGPDGALLEARVNSRLASSTELEARRHVSVLVPAGAVRSGDNRVEINCTNPTTFLGAVLFPLAAH